MHDKCFIIISEYYIIKATTRQGNGKSRETQKKHFTLIIITFSLHLH